MKKLQKVKQDLMKMILPKWEHVEEKYWGTISSFAFSYSMGRTLLEFCQQMGIQPENARVLIVGAAGGRDFHWLTGFGYVVDVLDLSLPPWECRAYLGDACRDETWRQIDETYDLIIMCDVLEHLPEDYSALKLAKTVLRENGRIFISLPYDHHVEITHVRSYSEATLTRLLTMAGYRVIWKKDRPGLIEDFPRVVNAINYGLSLTLPTSHLGAKLLHYLLRSEYFLNEKTRGIYRILGHSLTKGTVMVAQPVAENLRQDYVALNREMFSYSKFQVCK